MLQGVLEPQFLGLFVACSELSSVNPGKSLSRDLGVGVGFVRGPRLLVGGVHSVTTNPRGSGRQELREIEGE